MPIWNCPECDKQFVKYSMNGLDQARKNHERMHLKEMQSAEKITIAGYEVPLFLVERYMRTCNGIGKQIDAHEQIYVWLASKYKDAKEYSREGVSARFHHMHLGTAQKILAGESPFQDWGRFKKLATFQVELDKIIPVMWAKERRRYGR